MCTRSTNELENVFSPHTITRPWMDGWMLLLAALLLAARHGHFCFLVQVIKAISGKGAPACNCVAFTGMTGEAKMFRAPRKA